MSRVARLEPSRLQMPPEEALVKDTGELTRRLLETFRDLRAKRLSVGEARAQARVAEVILEAKRVEIVAGGKTFAAVSFGEDMVIEHSQD
jgi:hypothetical protein